MALRNLRYVLVETGKCEHCHRDAGDHTLEGLCAPNSSQRDSVRLDGSPQPAFRGEQAYAFIDMDSGEVRAWCKGVAA